MRGTPVSLFKSEKQVIEEAVDCLDTGGIPDEEAAAKYRELLAQYIKLYKQTSRLVNFSDRMQNELNRVNEKLLLSENKYRNIFENASEGIFRGRPDGSLIESNPALARIIDADSTEANDTCREIRLAEQPGYQKFIQFLKHKRQIRNFQTELTRRGGEKIWVEFSGIAIHDEAGNITHIEGIVSDVTEQLRLQQDLERMAHTDELTGICNRRFFYEQLNDEICRARCRRCPLSLLMIDADYFKTVNDRFGHSTGDRMLQQLARTCKSVLRERDILGRLGGEEFAVVLPGANLEKGWQVAERLRKCIAKTALKSREKTVSITVSMGLSQLTDAMSTTEELLKNADAALYQAKKNGRNLVCVYGES